MLFVVIWLMILNLKYLSLLINDEIFFHGSKIVENLNVSTTIMSSSWDLKEHDSSICDPTKK